MGKSYAIVMQSWAQQTPATPLVTQNQEAAIPRFRLIIAQKTENKSMFKLLYETTHLSAPLPEATGHAQTYKVSKHSYSQLLSTLCLPEALTRKGSSRGTRRPGPLSLQMPFLPESTSSAWQQLP
eukprot:scaffold196786_cov26-Tisochrysis_lutea.AAC.1